MSNKWASIADTTGCQSRVGGVGGGVSREKGGDISRVKTETRGQRQDITEQKRRLKPKRQHLRKERKKKGGGGQFRGQTAQSGQGSWGQLASPWQPPSLEPT